MSAGTGELVTVKNNPAFLDDEALIRGFVVRQIDLKHVLEAVTDSVGGPSRHTLVVAPRGMGKTTLVLRAAAEVRRDSELNAGWYPVTFAEESYGVLSAGELWLEAVSRIADQTGEARWRSIADSLLAVRDERDLRDRALARLMDFADERGVRLLLVIENLNMLFSEQLSTDDAWALRDTFQNEPRILVVATATQRFDQVDDVDKAFFELMRVIELPPLTNDECRVLWHRLTGELLEGDRVRPVRILTGGNTRLVAILASFAKERSLATLMKELVGLIDEYTIYFKANLESLPATERKVFVALADIWQPATAREVAERTRLDTNKCSALLKRLVSRGAVTEVQKSGGKTWYQVAERLYNIYHLMRVRGGEAERVRALVDFMVHLYGGREEFGSVAAGVLHEACGLGHGERRTHLQAFSGLVEALREPAERERLLREVLPHLAGMIPELPDSLRRSPELKRSLLPGEGAGWREWLVYIEHVRSLGPSAEEFREASRAFERLLTTTNPESDEGWLLLAGMLITAGGGPASGRVREALERARERNPQLPSASILRGWLATMIGDHQSARAAFRETLASSANLHWAWGYLVGFLEAHFPQGLSVGPLCEARSGDDHLALLVVAAARLASGDTHGTDESFEHVLVSAGDTVSAVTVTELYSLWIAWRERLGLDSEPVLSAIEQRWTSLPRPFPWGVYVRAARREPAKLEAHVERLIRAGGFTWVDAASLAMFVAGMGLEGLAMTALESVLSFQPKPELGWLGLILEGQLQLLANSPQAAFAAARQLLALQPNESTAASDLFVHLAAAGHAAAAAAMLTDSEWGRAAEPLVVALRLEAGEQVIAPQEVLEVAGDLRKKIAARRELLERVGATAPAGTASLEAGLGR
jgi:tetratricopeptide (TPR) repeat protein